MGRSYTKQLTAKHERVLEMVREATELGEVQFLSPVGSPRQTGYRNHAKLVFRHRRNRETHDQELILGVYKPGTHSVMPAESCIVHHRRLQPLLRSLLEEVEALEIPIYDERTGEGALRYALARTSDHTSLTHLTLVSATDKIAKLNTLILRMQHRHRELESVFVCVNAETGNNLLTSDIRQIKGPPALREKFGDLVLESRAGAFLQANTEIASRIYTTAAKWLDVWAADGVIDLYCGVGALGLSSINHNTRLLGIEASEAAIECAQANARRLKRHRAEFVAAPAENVLEIAKAKGFQKPSALIVNPPRKGLSQEAGEAIVELAPRKILYVSCEPETLVRDLRGFAREGWATRRVRVYDMLPQTPHVEVMALLEKTTAPIGLDSDD
ncbi:MAG: 23S rRNA (uracil(1939)-C(5))-methyltransferase RlmD [Candidatus Binatia bacterium]|nr:23S rRNA (uracil(1939)-C(5))-methyltransferase RlmD [Candidatus Binatia bacterium]